MHEWKLKETAEEEEEEVARKVLLMLENAKIKDLSIGIMHRGKEFVCMGMTPLFQTMLFPFILF